ncbi:TPA: terminase [Pseudomonas aeruginosa]|nr:terminase [Pseudomonas aeruginosa]HCF2689829.1 terminase [Pseudomonas aeruginosa]HCF4176014.1 terminase [Pseudomonas aeruginosa]HCF5671763.1 terminase [Pseudomonas aeruginosa]HCF7576172.1 terminase [Pseudomonas aeruginosa]
MTRSNGVIVAEGDRLLALHKDGRLNSRADLILALANKWYRLNALYKIKDKHGKVRRFRPNAAQRRRFTEGHVRDIILKARQLGFTTLEMIDALDDCLFTANYSAGCICHTLPDAKDIYRNKIRFAYEQLVGSPWMAIFQRIGMRLPRPRSDKDQGYIFDNGSSIQVSTSFRGGTLQRLHVSEFGKICKLSPDKAQEIVTGAFEAVALGCRLTIESTAEGREGYFFTYCELARAIKDAGRRPTVMDWQFHFFPWWGDQSYRLEEIAEVIVPQYLHEYFAELLAKHGVRLDRQQQAWYAKKAETLGEDMKREYPSTPDEAFDQGVKGAYYLTQMRWLRQQGRISQTVTYNPALPVFTAWDLGMGDAMSIVFFQVHGLEVRVIDYLEHNGEGMEYYGQALKRLPYNYGGHFAPHDIVVRELGTGKSRMEVAAQYGIKFTMVPRVSRNSEGVQAVRQFLPACWFAEDPTAADADVYAADDGEPVFRTTGVSRLVDCLDNYRKEWDPKLGVYRDQPRHDWASHGAKAFETLARCGVFEQLRTTASSNSTSNTEKGRRAWGAHT